MTTPLFPVRVSRKRTDGTLAAFETKLFTRVPCIGEHFAYVGHSGKTETDGRVYKVFGVVHFCLDGEHGDDRSVAEIWATEDAEPYHDDVAGLGVPTRS